MSDTNNFPLLEYLASWEGEALDLGWARFALETGSEHLLGRYLRETAEPDSRVVDAIQRLLGERGDGRGRRLKLFAESRGRPPRLQLSDPRVLADLLDPPMDAMPKLRLRFVNRRGRPGMDPLRRMWLRSQVRLAHLAEKKDVAIDDAAKAIKRGKSTIYRWFARD